MFRTCGINLILNFISSHLQALQFLPRARVTNTILNEERPARVLNVGVQLDRDRALLEHSLHLVGALLAQLAARRHCIVLSFLLVFLVGAVEITHEAGEHYAGLVVVLGVPVVRGTAELLRIVPARPEPELIACALDPPQRQFRLSPV